MSMDLLSDIQRWMSDNAVECATINDVECQHSMAFSRSTTNILLNVRQSYWLSRNQ